MENEQLSPFGNQSTSNETQADKEWSAFERDLDNLGRQLAALQVHTAALGSHLVSSLEAGFEDVKTRAASFRQAREARARAGAPGGLAAGTRGGKHLRRGAHARSTEAARQMWERAEPLRQGAKDVGEGLAARLGRVARLVRQGRRPAAHASRKALRPNGPVPARTEDRRETTW